MALHLSEKDLLDAWAFVSDFLHIQNPYKQNKLNVQLLYKKFVVWWEKIQALLIIHVAQFGDKKHFIIADVQFDTPKGSVVSIQKVG